MLLWARSQSYKNLISSFFRFLLLSLRVCSIRKYCLCYKMAKLNSKKQKKSSFYEEKSLVGLTPGLWARERSYIGGRIKEPQSIYFIRYNVNFFSMLIQMCLAFVYSYCHHLVFLLFCLLLFIFKFVKHILAFYKFYELDHCYYFSFFISNVM